MALEHGQSSEDVQQLQQHLADLGFEAPVTGSYDDATFESVVRFQEAFGLPVTGQADDDTLAAVESGVESGYGQEDYGDIDYETPDAEEAEPPSVA